MEKSVQFFTGLLVSAFMVAGLATAPAIAQDKAKAAPAAKAEKGKALINVLVDNDKVRVLEATFKPGDVATATARSFRVIRALKGGTMETTYADGKKEKVEYKTGQVVARGPDPVGTPKNVGKSTVVLYVMYVKEPKK